MKKVILVLVSVIFSMPVMAENGLEEALMLYSEQNSLHFDAERGKVFWNKINIDEDGKERTCYTCHGKDLKKSGKHVKTGKLVKAMAPSANPERYTELKKIKKWFKRNCKWTIGRECTNQEKGDVLTFLSQQ